MAILPSDESIHRVTMSLDDFAMIKDALSRCEELPGLEKEVSPRDGGENGEIAEEEGEGCDNREIYSRTKTNVSDEAEVERGRESESAEGVHPVIRGAGEDVSGATIDSEEKTVLQTVRENEKSTWCAVQSRPRTVKG